MDEFEPLDFKLSAIAKVATAVAHSENRFFERYIAVVRDTQSMELAFTRTYFITSLSLHARHIASPSLSHILVTYVVHLAALRGSPSRF